MDRAKYYTSRGGFTLIELLVVIAILAGMLLPALAKAKTKAQGIMCMNNGKQLLLGWRLYVDGSRDELPYAFVSPGNPQSPYAWVQGILDFSSGKPENYDTTVHIEKSPLMKYIGNNTKIWKCPSDTARVRNRTGQMVQRVRSMSMLNWVGGNGDNPREPWGGWGGGLWRVYRKMSDMIDPGPANTFVILDERETSINDAFFVVPMDGYRPGGPTTGTVIPDMPASYHNGAGGLSFADGHSEIHKWKNSFTRTPVRQNENLGSGPSNNEDVRWMQDHATRMLR